jgi:hypothetical protein
METLKGEKLWIFIFFLILLILFLAFFLQKTEKKEAVLQIDFGGNKIRTFQGEVVEGMTLFDALFVSSKSGNFEFEADDGGIISIGGLRSEGGKKWECFLNQKKVEKKLNEVFISPGDRILCKYH